MPLFGRVNQQPEPSTAETVTCPSCHEAAPADALVCPHCKDVLPPRAQPEAVASALCQSSAAAVPVADQAPGEQAGEASPVATATLAGNQWCPRCGGEFDTAEQLRQHVQLAHPTA